VKFDNLNLGVKMKLLKLGQLRYAVYAVYDENGGCPVLDSLKALGTNASLRMLHKLREYIPEAGPNFRNPEKVKRLKGPIAEFREQPGRGPKVRTLFFLDGQKVIVCTNAFEKRDTTPQAEIHAALEARKRYFTDKERGSLKIVCLENDDE
jgi:hypothetical protein